jgi:hypothetical protein
VDDLACAAMHKAKSRHRRRSQKKRVRDRVLLGGGSLPEREWNHAKGHKQVKRASNKMRFNVWVSLFFHFRFNLLSFCSL